ncbi:hypothetical protein BDV34DRAFT_195013 [Aspergillus parasiticus]|uniref:Uncharacterized protein n=1 Tax=Aspergillus parasiticus TaxID=5067 RepID=A0A5N6DP57_ASPPA|nr:hypothetical protein BDV34DRAFT_195013 [Aspergillus parasiticus]
MHTHTPHSNTSDNRRCQFPSNTYQKRPATQLAQTNMPMTSFPSGPGNVFSLAQPLQRLVLFAGACLDARLFQVVGMDSTCVWGFWSWVELLVLYNGMFQVCCTCIRSCGYYYPRTMWILLSWSWVIAFS